MTKTELEAAVAAYLTTNEATYEEAIDGVAKAISVFYKKKEKEEAKNEHKNEQIEIARDDLITAMLDYMECFTGEIPEEKYNELYADTDQAIREVEPDLAKLFSLIKFDRNEVKKPETKSTSDDDALRSFLKSIIG